MHDVIEASADAIAGREGGSNVAGNEAANLSFADKASSFA